MQTKLKFPVAGFTILFFCIINIASGQERTVIKDSLYSKILGENRNIEVLLPRNYKAGATEKYGVVYKLDGEWDTWLIPGSYDFAVGANFVPENIFVRIPNMYNKKGDTRNRDLSPTQIKAYDPSTGGADNFRAFLKDELLPYINKKYPLNGENTLVGGSLAGMFAIYTFLKDPHLFKSYVTVEAAMHWDNRYVNKLALEALPKLSNLENTTLWIAGRDGRAYEYMGIAQLDSILQVKAPKGLLWKTAAYPNETHYSAQYKGYYDGFRFIHSGYVKEIDVRPLSGILLKNQPFEVMVIQDNDSTSLRYTIDGSMPTTSSKKVHYFIPASGTTQLNIKSFSNRSENDKLVNASFQEGEPFAGSVKPKKGKNTGLQYAYYEGSWDRLPKFNKLKPIKAGPVEKDFKLNEKSDKSNSAYLIEGQVEIPAEGYYIFYIESAKDAKIYVADRLIIDGDNQEGNGKQSYVLPLSKGFYSLRVELLHEKGKGDLNFYIFQDKLKEKDEWWTNRFIGY